MKPWAAGFANRMPSKNGAADYRRPQVFRPEPPPPEPPASPLEWGLIAVGLGAILIILLSCWK